MPSAPAPRTRPAVVVAVVALVLVVAGAAFALTRDDGPDAGSRLTAVCAALGGRVTGSGRAGGTCDVPRDRRTVDTVALRPDGTADPADRARRRAACRTAATAAVDRAVALARRRTVTSYASVAWVAPGLCRARTVRASGAVAVRLRQARLLALAREATADGRAEDAVADAERADAQGSTAETRAAVGAARAALRRTTPRAPDATQVVSPNEYLGLSCAAIGHAFRVAPGSDPAHDPDGDGRACEG
ncbi:hypothetical protein [Patulibacter minatonensis]|uniref:hypothetical protein n=1 Tax=Patulibacter minatonensis TaxID=298163 RepID=UPI00047C5B64|nr:hypothetical protein [Patulibacter minatonensis]